MSMSLLLRMLIKVIRISEVQSLKIPSSQTCFLRFRSSRRPEITCQQRMMSNLQLMTDKPNTMPTCNKSATTFTIRTLSMYSKDQNEYETISEETLESLCEKFEEILETQTHIEDADVSLSSGVLNVSLGPYGTYVINKQTPNRQIWLSSPLSGPKRYDYKDGLWVYKYEDLTLHQLLSKEISKILKTNVDFSGCNFGSKT